MRNEESGMTLIEILVVIAILAMLAGMVSVMVAPATGEGHKVVCINHCREMVGLLESGGNRYPDRGGPNFILYLVKKGHLQGNDRLETLFCPGDERETLKLAGREAAYADLNLKAGDNGHLTSYAGRMQDDKACRVSRGSPRAEVLIADDSEDHHFKKGIVVGLSGGAARFRDKVDDYELDLEDPIEIGPGSAIPELKCMRAD